ncbi:MAG: thiol reductant ABC exporter subunit CydD [Anaerolineales bacterium]
MKPDPRLMAELRQTRRLFYGTLLFSLLGVVILIGQAYALSVVVNDVFLEGATLEDVSPVLLALLGLALLRFGALWAGQSSATVLAARIKQDVRERVVTRIFAMGPTYVGGERSGELINTLTEGIDALEDYLKDYLPQMFLALLVPVAFLLIIFPNDPLSGLVLLCTAPLLPFFMALIGMWAGKLSREQWHAMSYLSAHFLDVLQGLPTLKMFNRSGAQTKTIERLSDDFRRTTMRVLRVAFLSSFFLEFITTISIAIIAVEIGFRLIWGHMDFQTAFFILILAPEFYQPLRNWGASFHASTAGADAADRLFQVLEAPLPEHPAPSAVPLRYEAPPRIRFEGVSFQYPSRETKALDNLSLTLEPGQVTALVGASGAGKSTAAHLLLRFIEPESGRIWVDDTPLDGIAPEAWRAQVAWVSQRPYLFNMSVRENLHLARPDADQAALESAAEQAGALDFIRTLPQGWETSIGERGALLSGGQAARLALARAFLKDAPILIWDEATANLDPITEDIIHQAMHTLTQARTTLIIAHRLRTVFEADQIVVLDKGHLRESGTHQSLLGQGGLYGRMVGGYAYGT